MAVNVEQTPNPNARKFSVGRPVGGPRTLVRGDETGEEFLDRLLAVDGVASVFLTADFVTITKTPDGQWDSIVTATTGILEDRFGG